MLNFAFESKYRLILLIYIEMIESISLKDSIKMTLVPFIMQVYII